MNPDREHPSEEGTSAGPNWIPLRVVMQRYCEPYFAAASRWSRYADVELVQNRAQLVETAKRLFEEYSQLPETHVFELRAEHDVPLLAEVPPSQGREYRPGADQLARTAALHAKYVPAEFFNRVGVFFQKNLLKELAGWSDEKLLVANHDTRRSITAAVEKLLRLPESAGKAQFVLCEREGESTHAFPAAPLSEKGHAFVNALLLCALPAVPLPASAPAPAPVAASASPTKRERVAETVSEEREAESERLWLAAHPSVGKALLRRDGVEGRTIRYFPASQRGMRDQRYCVRWADETETEIGASEFETMRKLILRNKPEQSAQDSLHTPSRSHARTSEKTTEKKEKKKEKDGEKEVKKKDKSAASNGKDARPWTKEHESVGVSVAIFLAPSSAKGKSKKKIIRGEVVSYCPRSSESARDELFRVRWEDDDEQDLDEEDFLAAVALFAEHFDEPQWTSVHATVGTRVAAFFTIARKRKLFFGKISRYAPPSCALVNNQLYHVEWEDGDEQDLDEEEFQAAKALAAENESQDKKEMKKAETVPEANAITNADMEVANNEIVRQTNAETMTEPAGTQTEVFVQAYVEETIIGNEAAEESQPLSSTSSSSPSSSPVAMELREREEPSVAVANHSEVSAEGEKVVTVGNDIMNSAPQNEETEETSGVPEIEYVAAKDDEMENEHGDFAPFEGFEDLEETSTLVVVEQKEESFVSDIAQGASGDTIEQ